MGAIRVVYHRADDPQASKSRERGSLIDSRVDLDAEPYTKKPEGAHNYQPQDVRPKRHSFVRLSSEVDLAELPQIKSEIAVESDRSLKTGHQRIGKYDHSAQDLDVTF